LPDANGYSVTARTKGIHHLGLTVPDINAARAFFEEALGFKKVNEKPEYPAVFVSDGTVMLTLWQTEDPATAIPFDRRRGIGLHHVALQVESEAVLRDLHGTLSQRADVRIEFGPEPLGAAPLRHMMLRIPGNIRLELVAPAMKT
jgi:catechol 2,3-dioxygenase-like lactoylglutathione lyase family enzyme